jgi:hypothetical protein
MNSPAPRNWSRLPIGRTGKENGSAGTSLGKLLQVLVVLGLESDLARLASDDVLGRKLEDARLTETRRRAPKRKSKP